MPDLISVIVPVYNASEYVSQCYRQYIDSKLPGTGDSIDR